MRATSRAFEANAHRALVDATLQKALGVMKSGFQVRRAEAIANIREAIALYIEDCREAGDPIPTEAGKVFVEVEAI